MTSPDPAPPEPNRPEDAPYAQLGDALARAVSTRRWWRRWRSSGSAPAGPTAPGAPGRPGRLGTPPPPEPAAVPAGPTAPAAPAGPDQPGPGHPGGRFRIPLPGRRGAFPALAALSAVLVLSLVGIAAPWNNDPTSARGQEHLEPDGPVLLSPSPEPADPPSLVGGLQPGRSSPAPAPAPGCSEPLSVTVSPDLAALVRRLAGPLAGGDCPQVAVTVGPGSAGMAGTLANRAPDTDVWIPASTLSLRLASSNGGSDFPTSGTSIARSPIVIALPKRVAEALNSYPTWILIYQQSASEEPGIPRMSMPDHRTTVGALAQVTLQQALLGHWATDDVADDEGQTFLSLINFRNHLASTDADVGRLLDRMAGSTPARAGSEVGAFPATEQQLVAYHKRGPAVPVVPMGTYDANIAADYPMVTARSLDDRLAGVADQLRDRLVGAAAVQQLVATGFRPPDDPGLVNTGGFPADYPNPFPHTVDYPAPVPLPDPAKWRSIVDGWTWQG